MAFNNNKPFDVAPFNLERMACGVNALIEVLELPLPKLTECNPLDIAITASQILNKPLYVPMSIGEISTLIQNIIDEMCTSQDEMDQVMQACNGKYGHFILTETLI